MLIRKAKLHDVSSVYLLIGAATQRGKILKRSLKDIEKAIHHFWVLEHEGKVVACCAIEIYSKKLAEIRSLAVDARKERKGLASQLLERCIREAKRKKIYEVLAITDRENVFRRLGFSEQLHGQKALFLRP